MSSVLAPERCPISNLTPAQAGCIVRIGAFIRAHGYSPLRRELGGSAKHPGNSVGPVLALLEARGCVMRTRGAPRSLQLTALGEQVAEHWSGRSG